MEDTTNPIVTFEREDGETIELEMITIFDYKDDQYAVLCDSSPLNELNDDSTDEEIEQAYGKLEMYIMKTIVDENGAMEFVEPEEGLTEELQNAATEALNECDDDCCCEGDDCNEECSCGCHHDHD